MGENVDVKTLLLWLVIVLITDKVVRDSGMQSQSSSQLWLKASNLTPFLYGELMTRPSELNDISLIKPSANLDSSMTCIILECCSQCLSQPEEEVEG